MTAPARVHILTFCRSLDLLYGSELIFKTLRTGFPHARVSVVDNCSAPEARAVIARLARENECDFLALEGQPIEHHQFLSDTLASEANKPGAPAPLVFLDPDICLWKSCEDLDFDGLIAGRVFARFHDVVTGTITLPRLHSSFLWIPDARALQSEILAIRKRCFEFEPFRPSSFRLDGTWYRLDTAANLYGAIPDRVTPFREEHLEHFDHLFAGSHLDWLIDRFDEGCRKMLLQVHGRAKTGDLDALRGVWRYQDAVFARSCVRFSDRFDRSAASSERRRASPT